MTDARVACLFDEFSLAPSTPEAATLIRATLDRRLVGLDHFRRTFASLRAAAALPSAIDEKFARHFGCWLEVINQPYFKPIITSPHRLDALIELLVANRYVDVMGRPSTVVDVGTGHPPFTTVNLADRLPRATVHGVDLYSPTHLVQKRTGEYALFDGTDRLVSVHAPSLSQLHAMVIAWSRTRETFTDTLRAWRDGRHRGNGDEGCVVVQQPTRVLQRQCRNRRLRFHVNRAGGFALSVVPGGSVDVIWSFNCLLHYELPERQAAMRTLAARLRDGGIVFEGYTSPRGAHAVFALWQRTGDRLRMREFGFSAANLRFPLWPLHGRDPQVELLNRLLALTKGDCDLSSADDPAALTATVLSCHGYSAERVHGQFVLVRPNALATQQDFPEVSIAVPASDDLELAWAPA